jgi:hypothetical protein
MATREAMIGAIMGVANHPSVGDIKVLAPAFADAIIMLDHPSAGVPSKGATRQAEKETRVLRAVEQR